MYFRVVQILDFEKEKCKYCDVKLHSILSCLQQFGKVVD